MGNHVFFHFPVWRKAAPLGLVLLLSCGAPADQTAHRDRAVAEDILNPSAGAVLPVASGPELTEGCTRGGPRGIVEYFSPTPNEVRSLELRLATALDQERRRRSLPPVNDYLRQYIGIARAGGRKAIFVNAFPRAHLNALNRLLPDLPKKNASDADTVEWREHPVVVCDGGPAFWSAEFDLKTASFRNFRYNRPAG